MPASSNLVAYDKTDLRTQDIPGKVERLLGGLNLSDIKDFHFDSKSVEILNQHYDIRKKNSSGLASVHEEYARILTNVISSSYEPIDWQMDFSSGFRFDETLPHNRQSALIQKEGIDIKVPWELGRLQFLPSIALMAAKKEETDKWVQLFVDVIRDFMANNPVGMGVQWSCAMDVGIRVSNLLLAYDIIRNTNHELINKGLDDLIYKIAVLHGEFIYNNLEYKEGLTGNHYLFNLSGLLFVSNYCKDHPSSNTWMKFASEEIRKEYKKQFFNDGGNFEGSTSYHCLSAEMMAYSTALMLRNNVALSTVFAQGLYKTGRFVSDIAKPGGNIPQFGDNDSGRYFRLSSSQGLNYKGLMSAFNGLFGTQAEDGIEYHIIKALSSGKQLNGTPEKTDNNSESSWKPLKYEQQTVLKFNSIDIIKLQQKSYNDFGIHVFKSDQFYLAVSTICNSKMHHSWGHVHNDKLSFELQVNGKDLVQDPGTYCYTSDSVNRNKFRSVKAHHGILVNGKEQNDWVESKWGLFYLDRETKCKVLSCGKNEFIAEVKYYGVQHIRKFEILSDQLIITDWCNHPFKVNINKFDEYSKGYGIKEKVK